MSFVFCFKQKTAYEMRISDWSSDVCASDLKSEMDAQKKTFVEGAVARGVPEDQAAAIFDQVEKFAGYGFNKSHAAAYALVAYQTAYLKANYRSEERRVGTEGVRTCRYRWAADISNKNNKTQQQDKKE